MTLFFNLDVLEEFSLGNPRKFISGLLHWYRKDLPSRYNETEFCRKSLAGSSFILNPDDLFNDKTTDIYYVIQYIKLAARRDYSLYKLYNYRGLQLSYFPDLQYEAIKTNPLLKITNTDILFKYEEKQYGISI